MAINNPKSLRELSENYGKDRIIIALDSKEGRVVIKGWTEDTGLRAWEIVEDFEPYSSEILFTDVDVEGRMKGIKEELLEEVIENRIKGEEDKQKEELLTNVQEMHESNPMMGLRGIRLGIPGQALRHLPPVEMFFSLIYL